MGQFEDLALNQMTPQKSKFFSKDSDILLLTLTDKMGYGNWSEIRR